MSFKARQSYKEKECKWCEVPIENKDVYISMLMQSRPKAGSKKFFYLNYHTECMVTNIRTQVKKRREGIDDRKPKPMKSTKTSPNAYATLEYRKTIEQASPEQLLRRRRLLQYFNRDRKKLEKYYARGDYVERSRMYELIASRIDELIEIGLEFALNDLFTLITENDKPLAQKLVGTKDWGQRSAILKEEAVAIFHI